jgi:hypothetical protein
LHIDTYMGVLDGLTLKCGTTQYNDVATLANAEKGHPNYQEPLKQGQIVITPPNIQQSRLDILTVIKNKVNLFITKIHNWYHGITSGGTLTSTPNAEQPTFVNDNIIKRCRELSYDVLNLAILHDTQYLEEATELIDDVFKAQYFTDDEKNEIIHALNISTEMNNMCNLVTCVNSIQNKWYAPRKKREGEGEQKHANDPLNESIKRQRNLVDMSEVVPSKKPRQPLSEYEQLLPPNVMFPPLSQNSNYTQQPQSSSQTSPGTQLSPPSPQSSSQTSPGTQLSPLSPQSSSQTSPGTQLSPLSPQQWPGGGNPKTFKSSFFKDSAMPNWHSSASPFNQYATMKRLYRKNFKRFLLKYKMQDEQVN